MPLALRLIQGLIFALPWVALPGRVDPFFGPKEALLTTGVVAIVLTTWLGGAAMLGPWRNRAMGWLAR